MKKQWPVIVLVISLLALVSGCQKEEVYDQPIAPIPIDPSEYYKGLSLADIKALSGDTFDVLFSGDSRVYGEAPKEITGKFTTGTILTEEDAVRALTSVRYIMRMDDISYICYRISDERTHRRFFMQQIYRGIEVYDGEFQLGVDLEGEPLYIYGRHIGGIDVDTTPTLSAAEAKKTYQLEKDEKFSWSSLVVYKPYNDEPARLCWQIYIKAPFITQESKLIIDANTGELIESIPVAIS